MSLSSLRVLLGVAVGVVACGHAAIAAPTESESSTTLQSSGVCGGLLASDTGEITEVAVSREVRELEDFLTTDKTKNLAYRSPLTIMRAAQRVATFLLYKKPYTIQNPALAGGRVTIYPVLSEGIPETRGTAVIGQYEALEQLGDYILAAARGTGNTSKSFIAVGPAGTGKTEMATVLSHLGASLTTLSAKLEESNRDYFMYTWEWKDLYGIESLRPFVNAQRFVDDKGNVRIVEQPRRANGQRSPFVLFDAETQNKILEFAGERVVEMAGVNPDPVREPFPQDKLIKRAIIEHYIAAGELPAEPTPLQVVRVLSKHVRVVRRTFDDNNKFQTIDAQGNDVPYSELFAEDNAKVKMSYGSDHPFAHHYNGVVFKSDGGMLIADEFWRNRKELRDMFLRIIQSKQVNRGALPQFDLDILIIMASNNESITNAIAEGGSQKAQIDRAKKVNFNLSIYPHEVAKTMLLMLKEKSFMQRRLAGPDRELGNFEPARLNDLFPIPQNGAWVGPDGHYAIEVNVGPRKERVFVAPHTIMYMAAVVAGSRLVTDQKMAVREKAPFHVINTTYFTDVVTRLKVLMGDITVTPGQRDELRILSERLKEGTDGISMRDAAEIWLQNTINEAARPENKNTVTPELAKQVFLRLLDQEGITFANKDQREHWRGILQDVGTDYLLPAILRDVTTAMNTGSEAVNSIYEAVKSEILALALDKDATHYTVANQSKPIDHVRLFQLKAIYEQNTGRPFVPQEVINFHAQYGSQENRRHRQLLDAINTYMAARLKDLVTAEMLSEFARSQQGNTEVQSRFSQAARVMIEELGYNPVSMAAALDFVAGMTSQGSRR